MNIDDCHTCETTRHGTDTATASSSVAAFTTQERVDGSRETALALAIVEQTHLRNIMEMSDLILVSKTIGCLDGIKRLDMDRLDHQLGDTGTKVLDYKKNQRVENSKCKESHSPMVSLILEFEES